MKLKLALLVTGIVSSTVFGADAAEVPTGGASNSGVVFEDEETPKSEDEMLALAIEKSKQTAEAHARFLAKKQEYLSTGDKDMGKVKFDALKYEVGECAGNSNDLTKIDSLIKDVMDFSKTFQLTDLEQEELDNLLETLAMRASALTNAEKLGATKMKRAPR
jgi:hypothetical protein